MGILLALLRSPAFGSLETTDYVIVTRARPEVIRIIERGPRNIDRRVSIKWHIFSYLQKKFGYHPFTSVANVYYGQMLKKGGRGEKSSKRNNL